MAGAASGGAASHPLFYSSDTLNTMASPVKLTAPVPNLKEFGDRLHIDKSRQAVFIERRPDGAYAVRRLNAERAAAVLPTQKEAIERARKLIEPWGRIFVERVRNDSSKSADRWRKA